MWTWTSLVLLASLLFIGPSLARPNPDGDYKIPNVGTGRRAQYYVLHDDGTYKYGFDTGDGAFEQAMSKSVGTQTGAFGYTNPDGEEIRLEYEAGTGGFVARGDHLPRPSAELARALATVVRRNEPFVDPLANTGDASYNFNFESDDHSRSEQSNADGFVTGTYNYIDENGQLRKFSYRAGKGIGFQITGEGLTLPTSSLTQASVSRSHGHVSTAPKTHYQPSVSTFRAKTSPVITAQRARHHTDANIKTNYGVGGQYSFSYDAGTHSRAESGDENNNVVGKFKFTSPDDPSSKELEYEAGSGTGFIVRGDHLPVGPIVPGAEHGQPDGQFARTQNKNFVDPLASSDADSSYKFEFDSDTYSRSESADEDGNIVGTYTVVDDDGTRVTNEFRAGKGIGYEVKEVSRSAGPRPAPVQRYTGSTRTQTGSGVSAFGHARTTSQVGQTQYTGSLANIRSTAGDDGSYSFSYATDTHSRSESGDSDNNVDGEFSFVAIDDGKERSLKYEAGSDTGFIVEADHLPVGPVVPGAEDGKPSGRFAKDQSGEFVDPLASSDADSSYNFGFDSDTYSRTETADEDGNVVGTYTIVEEDGTRVTNQFRAGKGIGYEVKEISRVAGPRPTFRKATPSHAASVSHGGATRASVSHGGAARTTSAVSHGGVTHGAARQTEYSGPLANIHRTAGDDGSYSFSYSTDTHSRTESGDSDNNVRGDFSFVAIDDGVRRELEYEAGKETGFIVSADHLPVGPSVPGAEDGKPSGQFARYQPKNFVDPLAGSSGDSSYQFSFDSDSYSRNEKSDSDGNVEGTFTVVGDDGSKVTNRFRAGSGIGYQVEEVSRVQGAAPRRAPKKPSHSYRARTHATTQTHRSGVHTQAARRPVTSGVSHVSTKKITKSPSFKSSFSSSSIKSGHKPGSTVLEGPDFKLYQYNVSPQSDRAGYVIRYN